jgi:lipopolysaccharide/colanic/teichoic acid biosynthesis glycosyltransferase
MTAAGNVTSLGSFLRRYGLDELPQFVNVLRGQMSIVGPRPVLACDCPAAPECPRLRRFEMNPGMTGLWAVHEAEYAPFASYISPDETYRQYWSLHLDLVIIVRSLGAAVAGRGN